MSKKWVQFERDFSWSQTCQRRLNHVVARHSRTCTIRRVHSSYTLRHVRSVVQTTRYCRRDAYDWPPPPCACPQLLSIRGFATVETLLRTQFIKQINWKFDRIIKYCWTSVAHRCVRYTDCCIVNLLQYLRYHYFDVGIEFRFGHWCVFCLIEVF